MRATPPPPNVPPAPAAAAAGPPSTMVWHPWLRAARHCWRCWVGRRLGLQHFVVAPCQVEYDPATGAVTHWQLDARWVLERGGYAAH